MMMATCRGSLSAGILKEKSVMTQINHCFVASSAGRYLYSTLTPRDSMKQRF